MRVQCPKCGNKMQTNGNFIKRKQCVFCGRSFQIRKQIVSKLVMKISS